ncbi:imidazole glycerol phosphate synthase subunit HisH [Aurantivibrio infirmus]
MTQKRLAIIDYGMGNLHSVASAIKNVAPDVAVDITAEPNAIAQADHIIFPGVGAIRDCMSEILRLNVDAIVKQALADGKPVLAVCVGLQALMERSDENNGIECLRILPGQVRRFPSHMKDEAGDELKIPHMGWNRVEQTVDHPLWKNIANNSRFYFVHSYYVEASDESQLAGKTHYGLDFTSVLFRDNLFAAQFHPEKSHTDGLQLLKNFVSWDGKI